MAGLDAWNNLCTPAQVYAVLSMITIAGLAVQQNLKGVLANTVFAVVWTLALGWICTKCWTGFAWFLVLLPVIMAVLAIISAYFLVKDIKKEVRMDEKALVASLNQ